MHRLRKRKLPDESYPDESEVISFLTRLDFGPSVVVAVMVDKVWIV